MKLYLLSVFPLCPFVGYMVGWVRLVVWSSNTHPNAVKLLTVPLSFFQFRAPAMVLGLLMGLWWVILGGGEY